MVTKIEDGIQRVKKMSEPFILKLEEKLLLECTVSSFAELIQLRACLVGIRFPEKLVGNRGFPHEHKVENT